MTLLEELEGSVQGAVHGVGPAVVGLGRGWGVGSGVVVAPGRVLTNAHNLRHDEVSVTLPTAVAKAAASPALTPTSTSQ